MAPRSFSLNSWYFKIFFFIYYNIINFCSIIFHLYISDFLLKLSCYNWDMKSSVESLLLSVTFSPNHFKRIALKYRVEERVWRTLLAKNKFSRSRRNADRQAEKARRNLSRVRPSARRDEKMFSSSVTRDCCARVSNQCFPSSRVRAWNDFARERTLSPSRARTGRLYRYANHVDCSDYYELLPL